jgi:hypothetical protein
VADKLRRTFPIQISLTSGEQPTAETLSAIATQARNGLGVVEAAVGDLWTQSGDSTLALQNVSPYRKALQICNLGRAIGPSNSLSPHLLPVDADTINVTDEVALNNSTGNAAALALQADSSPTWSGRSLQASVLDVNGSGHFFFDATTGKIHSYDAMPSGSAINYDVDTANLPTPEHLSANVIPCLEQAGTYSGCRIVSVDDSDPGNTRFYLVLPPRTHRTATGHPHATSSLETTLSTSGNQDSVYGATPKYYWNPSSTILDDANSTQYRYTLPSLLDIESISNGARLPSGFLRLWDDNADGTGYGRVVDGIVFYKVADASSDYNQSYVVEIDAPAYKAQLDAAIANNYASGFRLLTAGATLSERVDMLAYALEAHRHGVCGPDRVASRRVSHQDLVDLEPLVSSAVNPFAMINTPALEVRMTKSNWQNDGHLQYLHRAGASYGTSFGVTSRDIYNNAMLGHILIGSTSKGASTPYFNNNTTSSFSLFFGEVSSTAPRLYYSTPDGAFHLAGNKPFTIDSGVLNAPTSLTPLTFKLGLNTRATLNSTGLGIGKTPTASLDVLGGAIISTTLNVAGAVIFGNALSVGAGASLLSTLSVAGAITASSSLDVQGASSLRAVSCTSLAVAGNSNITSGNFAMSGQGELKYGWTWDSGSRRGVLRINPDVIDIRCGLASVLNDASLDCSPAAGSLTTDAGFRLGRSGIAGAGNYSYKLEVSTLWTTQLRLYGASYIESTGSLVLATGASVILAAGASLGLAAGVDDASTARLTGLFRKDPTVSTSSSLSYTATQDGILTVALDWNTNPVTTDVRGYFTLNETRLCRFATSGVDNVPVVTVAIKSGQVLTAVISTPSGGALPANWYLRRTFQAIG